MLRMGSVMVTILVPSGAGEAAETLNAMMKIAIPKAERTDTILFRIRKYSLYKARAQSRIAAMRWRNENWAERGAPINDCEASVKAHSEPKYTMLAPKEWQLIKARGRGS